MWDDVLLEHVMRNDLLTPLDFEALKDRYIAASHMPEVRDIKSEDMGEMIKKLVNLTASLRNQGVLGPAHVTVEEALRCRHGA